VINTYNYEYDLLQLYKSNRNTKFLLFVLKLENFVFVYFIDIEGAFVVKSASRNE